jgi:hypothetical protein
MMREILILISLLGTISSGAQPAITCYTDVVDVQTPYTPEPFGILGNCSLINTDYDDLDQKKFSYYTESGQPKYGTFSGDVLDMADVYADILIEEPGFTGSKTITIKYLKWCFWQQDYIQLDSWSTVLYSPNAITVSVPDMCPNGIVDYNGFTSESGGSYLITGINFTSGGVADMSNVSPGTYSGLYNITIGGCNIEKVVSSFEVFDVPTVSWSGTPPVSMLDSDAPLNISAFINSTNSTSEVAWGPGVIESGGVYYFDPSLAGGVGNKEIHIGAYNIEGCLGEAVATNLINVVHDPGVPQVVFIDLEYSGFDQVLDDDPGYVFDYDQENWSGSYAFGDGLWMYYALQLGHQVCSEDTIEMKVGHYDPTFTYTWYSDVGGSIVEVGTGEYYTEYVPATANYLDYKIYLSATNNLSVESPLDPFILSVQPKPNVGVEETICLDGDSTIVLDYNYDHILADSLYVNGVLDVVRLERMTSYLWYDINDNYLGRGYDYNYIWNGTDKVNQFKVYRTDSSGFPIGAQKDWIELYPSFLDDGTSAPTFDPYHAVACECVSDNFLFVNAVKNPEVAINSNLQGEIAVGTPVLFTDQSMYSNSVNWDFDDGSSLYDSDTIWHYFNDIGIFSITAIAVDTFGCSDINTYGNYLFTTDWLTIEEVNEVVEVYPNPTAEYINITYTTGECLIYDVEGTLRKREKLNGNPVWMEGMSSGSYNIIVLSDSGEVVINKIIVKI